MFDHPNGNSEQKDLLAGFVGVAVHPFGSATENKYRRSEGMTRHG
ncbi:hypothetical protein SAMN05444851_1428 [Aliiroseovarius sediminilitoris]|uniref:Transposase n=1 Tax=Aliiroseovarius sediminilitoris TaxID=1173584 RepID=A0A1I0P8W5_9RHOB|nr:hypothetical protein [Aliiroseovarius sediminilitoris]SEW10501.1 hypothetical protein SAMN05444851_1428 [Aliiroseovarius sediminilitoris]